MHFRERLTVPLLWWVPALGLAGSMLLAFGFYLGPVWGIGVGLATLAIAGGVFASASIRLTVEGSELHVGRAVLDLAYAGEARALPADQTRRRADLDADARAYLVLRPYVATAVEVTLADADDPAPYWLVSTRRPAELAAAIERAAQLAPPRPGSTGS